jgi:two-component sensor histidine kinase
VWPRSRQLFYQRPVAALELLSGIQTALLARLRQRDVRDHIERETELRHELNHRVKNILASVTSIFEMTRRGSTDLEQFSTDFRGRLGALAQVHSAVFRADAETITVADIADLTFRPYRSGGDGRIASIGPSVTVTGAAGTTLALCLHELTTNAIKYGALSVPQGRVVFRWEASTGTDPDLAIYWIEAGGPVTHAPERFGYGTRYLRSALTGLFGRSPTIEFRPEGLRCEASGPLSRVSCNPKPEGGVDD